ncbi:MAG: hypothetical protein WBI82_09450 [Sphaerochaeta sp.]
MRHEYTLFKLYKDTKNKKGRVQFFNLCGEEEKRIAKTLLKKVLLLDILQETLDHSSESMTEIQPPFSEG